MARPLWAPWRMAYIEGSEPKSDGCFLCLDHACDRTLLLWDDGGVRVLLNRFPYNPGHALIAPAEHRGDYSTLPDRLASALDRTTRGVVRAFTRVLTPDGVNVGMNLGRAAGAGVPGHLHIHVVPRWSGDNNFMPVLADTRVIPEHLERTVAKLQPALEAELSDAG